MTSSAVGLSPLTTTGAVAPTGTKILSMVQPGLVEQPVADRQCQRQFAVGHVNDAGRVSAQAALGAV